MAMVSIQTSHTQAWTRYSNEKWHGKGNAQPEAQNTTELSKPPARHMTISASSCSLVYPTAPY